MFIIIKFIKWATENHYVATKNKVTRKDVALAYTPTGERRDSMYVTYTIGDLS